jgi:hypothetical protein
LKRKINNVAGTKEALIKMQQRLKSRNQKMTVIAYQNRMSMKQPKQEKTTNALCYYKSSIKQNKE